ncbi:MAG: hypothetical protein F6K00_35070 [Leptolyngbya sp. SIOISBB]|nr:hypothetical protein [Leptolyngbya sp. SIOISBB]
MNGNSDFDGDPLDLSDDALIYSGQGFTLNGRPILPVQRDANGNPMTDEQGRPILVDNAVAVSANHGALNAPQNQYANLVPPQIVDTQIVDIPTHAELVTQTLANHLPEGTQIVEFSPYSQPLNNHQDWETHFPTGGTPENPKVVNLTGWGLNIPHGVQLENTVLIVENGDVNFNGNGHQLNNVTLVVKNGGVNLANVQGSDVTVLASRHINMNGSARFAGDSFLASEQSIHFNGATSSEGDRLTVISQRDITFNGQSDTRAQFTAAGNFSFNGRSTLYGGIEVKGDVIFNGQATVVAIDEKHH